MKNGRYFSFIILSVVFQSASGIIGKYATLSMSPAPSPIEIITNSFYILALGCLILQALVWQQALRHFPLSFAYPFIGLVNFVVLFSSAVLFQEGITMANVIGLFLISGGITLLSQELGAGS
jgi:multidrug transporter EmrE-like cation transporter